MHSNDPNETSDSDGDGVGDNADAFPNDSNETSDSDGDGVGDNADAFPNDPNETSDSDGDGVGDNADGCQNTEYGSEVDDDGCVIQTSGVLRSINLDNLLVPLLIVNLVVILFLSLRKRTNGK